MEKMKKTLDKGKRLFMIIMVIIVVLTGCATKNVLDTKTEPAQVSTSRTVEVTEAKLVDWTSKLTYKANLNSIEEVVLSSKIAGQVNEVLFKEGDIVSAGQALVILDDETLQNQLKTAEITLKKLEIGLESAQKKFDNTKALYEAGASPKSELEEAESALEMTQADIESARITIQNINYSLNNSVLRAQIAGEISDKNISLGQYLSPGIVLAKIKNNSSIEAVIQLKQSDLDKVKVGRKVTLKLSQTDTTGFEGEVKTIAASANSQSRVFNCRIQINNSAGNLHPGVFGYIEIPDSKKNQVLSVPLAALTGSEGSYSVFTIENNTARKHSVSIGEIQNDMVEVASGLNARDNVIVTNLNTLQDGDKVQIAEPDSPQNENAVETDGKGA